MPLLPPCLSPAARLSLLPSRRQMKELEAKDLRAWCPLMHAAWSGSAEVFRAVVVAIEDNLGRDQVRCRRRSSVPLARPWRLLVLPLIFPLLLLLFLMFCCCRGRGCFHLFLADSGLLRLFMVVVPPCVASVFPCKSFLPLNSE